MNATPDSHSPSRGHSFGARSHANLSNEIEGVDLPSLFMASPEVISYSLYAGPLHWLLFLLSLGSVLGINVVIEYTVGDIKISTVRLSMRGTLSLCRSSYTDRSLCALMIAEYLGLALFAMWKGRSAAASIDRSRRELVTAEAYASRGETPYVDEIELMPVYNTHCT